MKSLMHNSATKSVILLCIIAVSTVGAILTGLTLTKSDPKTVAIQAGEYANQVTIYGNGITFINYRLNVTLEPGTNTIQFYLPANTVTDTLTLSGVNIIKITTSEDSHALIEKGDTITVYTQDATYTGKFIGWNDMLLLEANNGTIMIPGDRITKIIISEVVQIQGPRILVQATTDAPPEEYALKISYLMRGPKWSPTYFIDLDTSHLDCWATIENVETWADSTLTLVSGGPHLVITGPIYFAGQRGLAPSLSFAGFTPTTTDEHHEYTYNGNLSFENGTTVKLPLFNGTIALRQEYFWTNDEVQNRYHITNILSEPLASGTVEFYRGEKWMGEDSITYTPANAETTAIVNYAEDIKVTSTITKSVNDYYHHQVQGTQITVLNHKTTSIQITVQQDIDGYTLNVCNPSATRVGSTLTWQIQLDAGENTTLYYEWEYNW